MGTLLLFYLAAGLLLIGLSIPLIRRKVPPNAWYGFRVPQTWSDPETWHAANACAGKDLFAIGMITLLAAAGFYRMPGISLAALAVCVIQCFRYLAKLKQESDTRP